MALYKITRTDYVGWDEFDALIVRAKNERNALEVLAEGDSRWPTWSGFKPDASNAKVEKISPTGETEVILGSFNAG